MGSKVHKSIDLSVTEDQRLIISKIKLGQVLSDEDYLIIFKDLVIKFGRGTLKDKVPTKIESYLLSKYFPDFDRLEFLKRYNNYLKHA